MIETKRFMCEYCGERPRLKKSEVLKFSMGNALPKCKNKSCPGKSKATKAAKAAKAAKVE